jgi:hypothetical protein
MALRLGAPESVECIKKVGPSKYTFPQQTVLRFDFPARGSMPPVKIFWHDSLKEFLKFDGVPEGELIGDDDNNGSLFIGDKGMVTTGCYGERTRLLPDAKMKDYKLPPPLLTRSPGHYADWIRSCLLQFQRGGAIRAVDAAGRDRDEGGRQAGMGRHEEAVQQQQRRQPVPQAELPQGLEAGLSRRTLTFKVEP